MGFYIRKSISVGPFRFNLSKSGLGVSAGVKGLRIGSGPRGNYIHMGRGGLYYRTTLNPKSNAKKTRPAVPHSDITHGHMQEIESASTATIVDSSSADLVAEINSKHKKVRIWPFIASVGFVLGVGLSGVGSPSWAFPAIISVTLLASLIAAYYDKIGKTTVLLYELDSDVEQRYQKLHDAFQAFTTCCGRWHISAHGNVEDQKYHAGASSLIKRAGVQISYGNPPFIKSNVTVPSVPVGRQTLYFFPDKVLIFEPNSVGAVSYRNLVVSSESTRFIEDDRVPGDAKVVDHTWQYVNKNGGPDRRFNNNRELPIVLYESISFTSDTGLNEQLHLSQVGIGKKIAGAIRLLANVTE